MSKEVKDLVERRWAEYGIGLGGAEDGRMRHIPGSVAASVTSLTDAQSHD